MAVAALLVGGVLGALEAGALEAGALDDGGDVEIGWEGLSDEPAPPQPPNAAVTTARPAAAQRLISLAGISNSSEQVLPATKRVTKG